MNTYSSKPMKIDLDKCRTATADARLRAAFRDARAQQRDLVATSPLGGYRLVVEPRVVTLEKTQPVGFVHGLLAAAVVAQDGRVKVRTFPGLHSQPCGSLEDAAVYLWCVRFEAEVAATGCALEWLLEDSAKRHSLTQ